MERTLSLGSSEDAKPVSTLENLGSVNLMQAKRMKPKLIRPGAGRTARPRRPRGEAATLTNLGNVSTSRAYARRASCSAEAMDYRRELDDRARVRSLSNWPDSVMLGQLDEAVSSINLPCNWHASLVICRARASHSEPGQSAHPQAMRWGFAQPCPVARLSRRVMGARRERIGNLRQRGRPLAELERWRLRGCPQCDSGAPD